MNENLELRKQALEALGWRKGTIAEPGALERWFRPDGTFHCLASFVHERLYLPAIESDPAVSEPLFLEWCENNGIYWRLEYRAGVKTYEVTLWGDYIRRIEGLPQSIVEVVGATPSEARAKAIVAAKGVKVDE